MSSVTDIFGSSSDSHESFEGFSVTEMTKTKKTSSGKQSQKHSGPGNSQEQDPTEPRAGLGRPTLMVMPMVDLTDQCLWL